MRKTAMERNQLARPFEQSIKQFGEVVMNDQSVGQLDQRPTRSSYKALSQPRRGPDNHFTRTICSLPSRKQKQAATGVIPRAVLLMDRRPI